MFRSLQQEAFASGLESRPGMRIPLLVSFLLLTTLSVSCNFDDDQSLMSTSRRVFGTIPPSSSNDSAALVELGRHLYMSTELSVNRTQSCNSCHPVDRAGADGLATSPGALGAQGRRNSPSVFNAEHQLAQFWDGRSSTLEEQASGPIINPDEMAMPDAAAVAERLRHSDGIDRNLFAKAFPGEADPLTLEHAARAIAAFERTLRTSDRFERFQNGDATALTRDEKKGLRLFMDSGCASCHNGPLLGGNRFMKMGLTHPYDNVADKGRYEVTRHAADAYVFKVPSLRNVAQTAPYFHDGRAPGLSDAVERMAWHQLGRKFADHERQLLVAFLHTLTHE
jgi:cytochrome c peroxidase